MVIGVAAEQVTRLRKEVRRVQGHAFAGNTNATYTVGATAFLMCALWFGLMFDPPTDEALATWVVFQAQTCAYATIKTYLYGVRAWVLARPDPWIFFSYLVSQLSHGVSNLRIQN